MSLNLSPHKEKFCSIISEIVDRSKDVIVEAEDILEYDAIELTLLLKSIGFRLFSLEFNESANDQINDIEVEIKCRRSGLNSKMILQSNKCTCPARKSANNNSFWEVQGIAPTTPEARSKGIVQDASCNLLPDIPRKSSKFAKAMLAVLLQNYQMNFSETTDETKSKTLDVKQIVERFQSKEVNNGNNLNVIRGNSVSPANRVNTLGTKTSHCSTPLSSINATPTPSYDGSIENTLPKTLVTTASSNNETVNEVTNNENVGQNFDKSTDAQSQNSDENVSSKVREKTFDKLSVENEKDICLIKEIQEARKHLDSALLMLKCNVTKDLSSSSILTVTPQIPKKKQQTFPLQKNVSINKTAYLSASSTMNVSNSNSIISQQNNTSTNRRHSTGGRLDGRNDSITLRNQSSKDTNGNGSGRGGNGNGTTVTFKRRTIGGTPSSTSSYLSPSLTKSGPKSLDSSKLNFETRKLANRFLNSNNVKPVIKRTSTGTNLKSNLIKAQITKSVGKLPMLVKDVKK